MKKALVISHSDVSLDPRPLRAIKSLSELDFTIDCLCLKPRDNVDLITNLYIIPALSNALYCKILRKMIDVFICLVPFEFIKEFFHLYRYNLQSFKGFNFNKYDLIIVEDLSLIPLVSPRATKSKIVFDAREFYPRQNEERLFFRLFEMQERIRICHKYFKKNHLNITVSPGLKTEYDNLFGTEMIIILSAPNYIDRAPQKTGNVIRIVHHGAANRNRKIENMIEVGKHLPLSYQLDFYLVGSDLRYINELKKLAFGYKNIRILEPVAHDDINSMLSKYDIGIFIVEPTTFNLKYCMPNKLFEFIQAKLMVCVGPSPDMAGLVSSNCLGIVLEDYSPETAVQSLLKLDSDKIDFYKRNSYVASKKFNRDIESEKFKKYIKELM